MEMRDKTNLMECSSRASLKHKEDQEEFVQKRLKAEDLTAATLSAQEETLLFLLTPTNPLQVREVLAQIFKHLDLAEQCRVRRICRLWNEVLQSPKTLEQVVMKLTDRQQYYATEEARGSFQKCVKNLAPHVTSLQIVFVNQSSMRSRRYQKPFRSASEMTASQIFQLGENWPLLRYVCLKNWQILYSDLILLIPRTVQQLHLHNVIISGFRFLSNWNQEDGEEEKWPKGISETFAVNIWGIYTMTLPEKDTKNRHAMHILMEKLAMDVAAPMTKEEQHELSGVLGKLDEKFQKLVKIIISQREPTLTELLCTKDSSKLQNGTWHAMDAFAQRCGKWWDSSTGNTSKTSEMSFMVALGHKPSARSG